MNDLWTLLNALIYTFNESVTILDKTFIHVPCDIQLSIICCTILTKLAMVIEYDWSHQQLVRFRMSSQSWLLIILHLILTILFEFTSRMKRSNELTLQFSIVFRFSFFLSFFLSVVVFVQVSFLILLQH